MIINKITIESVVVQVLLWSSVKYTINYYEITVEGARVKEESNVKGCIDKNRKTKE